jgi:hypothetical protein
MERGNTEIINQGWIYKRSRHLKRWRKRWMVLTPTYLCTYKTEDKKGRTEHILLQECMTIKSVDEELKVPHSFRLDSANCRFFFRSDDQSSKEVWIGSIGKYMIKPGVLRSKSEEDALNGDY